jgi:hypothetical protein
VIISSHVDKIKRLNDVRRRLHPLEDFELWFWSTMVAGTNAVNAALHHAGVTPAEHAFPSQPGVYYVPVPAASGYQPVLKAKGDVLHVGRPPIAGPVPEDIMAMMAAMECIEAYRDPCTRGDTNPSAEIVDQCEFAYAQCIQLLKKRLPEFKDETE